MQLVVRAVAAFGGVAATRRVGEVEVPGPVWGGEVGLGGGEGAPVGGGGARGPVLTASESVVEAVAVGVLVTKNVPVIELASLIDAIAGVVLPTIVIIVVEGEVVEEFERVVRGISVWFDRFGRGDRVEVRRLMDQGRDGAAA